MLKKKNCRYLVICAANCVTDVGLGRDSRRGKGRGVVQLRCDENIKCCYASGVENAAFAHP